MSRKEILKMPVENILFRQVPTINLQVTPADPIFISQMKELKRRVQSTARSKSKRRTDNDYEGDFYRFKSPNLYVPNAPTLPGSLKLPFQYTRQKESLKTKGEKMPRKLSDVKKIFQTMPLSPKRRLAIEPDVLSDEQNVEQKFCKQVDQITLNM